MKKIPIIISLLVVGAVVLFLTAADQIGTYSTFSKAQSSHSTAHIVGELQLDMEMHYDPQIDPNYFSFYAKDQDGRIEKVVFIGSKPQDFERTEQIVMTGRFKENAFVATEILTKCPSKYKDEEIYIRSKGQDS